MRSCCATSTPTGRGCGGPEFDTEYITPVIGPLFDELETSLSERGVTPVGPPVAFYTQEEGDASGSDRATVHAAFPVPVDVESADGYTVTELAAAPMVAQLVHHGSMATIGQSWQALADWIDGRPDLRPSDACREVYVVSMPAEDQSGWVTHLQWPVTRV